MRVVPVVRCFQMVLAGRGPLGSLKFVHPRFSAQVNRFPEGGGALMRHGVHLPKEGEPVEHPMRPNPKANEFLSSSIADDDDDDDGREDNGLSIENIAMASVSECRPMVVGATCRPHDVFLCWRFH